MSKRGFTCIIKSMPIVDSFCPAASKRCRPFIKLETLRLQVPSHERQLNAKLSSIQQLDSNKHVNKSRIICPIDALRVDIFHSCLITTTDTPPIPTDYTGFRTRLALKQHRSGPRSSADGRY